MDKVYLNTILTALYTGRALAEEKEEELANFEPEGLKEVQEDLECLNEAIMIVKEELR